MQAHTQMDVHIVHICVHVCTQVRVRCEDGTVMRLTLRAADPLSLVAEAVGAQRPADAGPFVLRVPFPRREYATPEELQTSIREAVPDVDRTQQPLAAPCGPHAHQPWAPCDPHAHQPWGPLDPCLAALVPREAMLVCMHTCIRAMYMHACMHAYIHAWQALVPRGAMLVLPEQQVQTHIEPTSVGPLCGPHAHQP